MMVRSVQAFVVLIALAAASGSVAYAQSAPAPGPDDPPNVSPLEIQRMFDAYALVQAQEQLKLSDDRFPQFLTRFKALQEIRRRGQADRVRILRELGRLSQAETADTVALKERLKALQDVEERSAVDIRNAYQAIDQALDVQQQAKFRLFEELMERRKIELVTRARQNRPRGRR